MGKHVNTAREFARLSTDVRGQRWTSPEQRMAAEQRYQERLDWHEKIITGERQEKNPDDPIVWPFTGTLRVTQD